MMAPDNVEADVTKIAEEEPTVVSDVKTLKTAPDGINESEVEEYTVSVPLDEDVTSDDATDDHTSESAAAAVLKTELKSENAAVVPVSTVSSVSKTTTDDIHESVVDVVEEVTILSSPTDDVNNEHQFKAAVIIIKDELKVKEETDAVVQIAEVEPTVVSVVETLKTASDGINKSEVDVVEEESNVSTSTDDVNNDNQSETAIIIVKNESKAEEAKDAAVVPISTDASDILVSSDDVDEVLIAVEEPTVVPVVVEASKTETDCINKSEVDVVDEESNVSVPLVEDVTSDNASNDHKSETAAVIVKVESKVEETKDAAAVPDSTMTSCTVNAFDNVETDVTNIAEEKPTVVPVLETSKMATDGINESEVDVEVEESNVSTVSTPTDVNNNNQYETTLLIVKDELKDEETTNDVVEIAENDPTVISVVETSKTATDDNIESVVDVVEEESNVSAATDDVNTDNQSETAVIIVKNESKVEEAKDSIIQIAEEESTVVFVVDTSKPATDGIDACEVDVVDEECAVSVPLNEETKSNEHHPEIAAVIVKVELKDEETEDAVVVPVTDTSCIVVAPSNVDADIVKTVEEERIMAHIVSDTSKPAKDAMDESNFHVRKDADSTTECGDTEYVSETIVIEKVKSKVVHAVAVPVPVSDEVSRSIGGVDPDVVYVGDEETIVIPIVAGTSKTDSDSIGQPEVEEPDEESRSNQIDSEVVVKDDMDEREDEVKEKRVEVTINAAEDTNAEEHVVLCEKVSVSPNASLTDKVDNQTEHDHLEITGDPIMQTKEVNVALSVNTKKELTRSERKEETMLTCKSERQVVSNFNDVAEIREESIVSQDESAVSISNLEIAPSTESRIVEETGISEDVSITQSKSNLRRDESDQKTEEVNEQSPLVQSDYEEDELPLNVEKIVEAMTVITRATELKSTGNKYFLMKRYVPARKCYAEGIDMIQSASYRNDEMFVLLGTLLSNRAQCLLDTAQNMSTQSAVIMVREAVNDCQVALKSTWADTVPPLIRLKLRRRRSVATEQSVLLSNRIRKSECELTSRRSQELTAEALETQRRRRPRRRVRKMTSRQRQKVRRKAKTRQHQSKDENSEMWESGSYTEAEESLLPPDTVVQMGQDLIRQRTAVNVTEADDICPICQERFRVELANTYTVVLPCRHACCLPCLADLKRASTHRSDHTVRFNCPTCYFSVEDDCLNRIASHLVKNSSLIQERLDNLQSSTEEKNAFAEQLLVHHMFDTNIVIKSVDSMVIDHLQKQLWEVKQLTQQQKQDIYEIVCCPPIALRDELQREESIMKSLRDYESEKYIQTMERCVELRKEILVAYSKAKEQVFSRIISILQDAQESCIIQN